MSRIINTALCSFGMSGKVFHAPFLELHPGFHLYGVWERSAKNAFEEYPAIRSVSRYEDLLADPAIELVVVNTPNSTHYEYAKLALEAGKHVVVEKAFTVSLKEAEDLVQISQRTNRKIIVYQNRRWDSDFLTTKEVLLSGQLGTIMEAEIHFDRYNPELSPKLHKETGAPGAGVLHDLGPHLIDAAIHLFGNPQAVFADLRILRENSIVNDYMDILLYYPDTRVRLKAGYFVKQPLPAFILHGRNGSFLKEHADVQEDSLKKGLRPVNNQWGMEPQDTEGLLIVTQDGIEVKQKVPAHKGNYMRFYDGVYDALVHDKPPPVSNTDSLTLMKIIEAALESHKEGKVISLTG